MNLLPVLLSALLSPLGNPAAGDASGGIDAGPGLVLDVGVALTMEDRKVIHNARILIADGKIRAVGSRRDLGIPSGWKHLSYPDSFAFPGAVDIHTHIQTGGFEDVNDMVNPDNPELRVLDTVRPWNRLYRDACAGGVTVLNGIPGSGTNLSGAGALVKAKPSARVDEVVLRSPGCIKVAQGHNPERRGGDLGASRMGMWWMLRWWIARGREAFETGHPERFPDVAQLAGVFAGQYPVLVHTADARDTYGTVRMFQLEAGVPVVVSHASFHGYLAAREIARVQAPLNVGPRNFDHFFNQQNRIQGLVQAYEAGGNTDISVQTDATVVPPEEFLYQATLAERLGCSTWIALESINAKPARQILADHRVGRLRPGLDADIVVKAGQPLDPRSPVQLVLVDGEVAYDIRQGQRY